MANSTNKPITDGINIGDIWFSRWGYDQVNVDYFRVTDVTKCFITLVEVPKIRRPEGNGMYGKCEPNLSKHFIGEGYKRKVQEYKGEKFVWLHDHFAKARPWDGKPIFYSDWH